MRRCLYLDCFAGLSGDMFLGALSDLRPELFKGLREKMLLLAGSGECRIELERVRRSSVSAAKAVVDVSKLATSPRRLDEILARILAADYLAPRVRERGEAAFRLLFEAEAAVHGTDMQSVHLHEAGATDALIDILGTFHLIEALGVTTVFSSPLNLGGGFVECSHGTYPVPAPATAHLLRGLPVYSRGPAIERVTPTGAALLRVLSPTFSALPRLTYERIGYGAGDNDTPGFPNVLRVFLGEESSSAPVDSVVAVEATIDDMTGQQSGYFLERALALGAVDVYFTPIFMKKSRPATKLTCLCPREKLDSITRLFFEESTTLGLRFHEMDRLTLDRDLETVETPWGAVRIKLGRLDGAIVNYHPEYEDCAAIARAAGVPLKKVQAEAVASFVRLHTDATR